MSAQDQNCESEPEARLVIEIESNPKYDELERLWKDIDYVPDMSVFEYPTQPPQYKPKKFWQQFEMGVSGLPVTVERMLKHRQNLIPLAHKVFSSENQKLCALSKRFRKNFAKMQAIPVFTETVSRRYAMQLESYVDSTHWDETDFKHRKFEIYLKRCASIIDVTKKPS
jgi:hypothetical protein